MILLLMVIVLLALAWGLTGIQLNAPIERPEPPIPVITKPTLVSVPAPVPPEAPLAEPISSESSTELAPAPPVGELPAPPGAEPPPS